MSDILNVNATWSVSTEGDCEGRSNKNLGIFVGTIPQIIRVMIDRGIRPYYTYRFSQIEIVNATNSVSFNLDDINVRSEVKTMGRRCANVALSSAADRKQQSIAKAQKVIDDLSPEQRAALKELLNK